MEKTPTTTSADAGAVNPINPGKVTGNHRLTWDGRSVLVGSIRLDPQVARSPAQHQSLLVLPHLEQTMVSFLARFLSNCRFRRDPSATLPGLTFPAYFLVGRGRCRLVRNYHCRLLAL